MENILLHCINTRFGALLAFYEPPVLSLFLRIVFDFFFHFSDVLVSLTALSAASKPNCCNLGKKLERNKRSRFANGKEADSASFQFDSWTAFCSFCVSGA